MLLFRLLFFFSIFTFPKKFFQEHSVSNGLDPDQDRPSVGPDLSPNCLQKLLADKKLPLANLRKELNSVFCFALIDSILLILDCFFFRL